MDRSKEIFGNKMSSAVQKKAEQSKQKYAKKYGDDSHANYSVKLRENACLYDPLGVYDITPCQPAVQWHFLTE